MLNTVRGRPAYARRPPLVLINGLAEQAESWYCNLAAWREHFDVHQPNLLAYEGAALHRRIEAGLPVDVDYLVGRLHEYIDGFVQAPRCHLVANSLGGKVAIEFAVRFPQLVGRLVLLCPSGLGDEERLPIVEGVRRGDPASLVTSVFHDPSRADIGLLGYYRERFASRRWKTGLLRTVRGTSGHRARARLPELVSPTLLVVGEEDRIVAPQETAEAVRLLPNGRLVVLPACGHAPQIEEAEMVNRLVVDFIREGQAPEGA
jgi:pimeloyl-ACP methyl ester carboxylesterase